MTRVYRQESKHERPAVSAYKHMRQRSIHLTCRTCRRYGTAASNKEARKATCDRCGDVMIALTPPSPKPYPL